MPELAASAPRRSIRKPLSEPMLIRHGLEWQVCYKARGKLDGRSVEAWVYGPEGIFFCEVGREDQIVNLPMPDKFPFFDDRYVHEIERIDANGKRWDRLAGANNIIAANAAWSVLVNHTTYMMQMRQGSRIMRTRE